MASQGAAESNYAIFRECVSSVIIARSNQHKPSKTPKRKPYKSKRAKQRDKDINLNVNPPKSNAAEEESPEDLADFIDFIASEIFTSLPGPLQALTYATFHHTPSLSKAYTIPLPPQTLETLLPPIPPSVTDTLTTYGYTPDLDLDTPSLLSRSLADYVPSVTRPPPLWANTRTSACELCARDWIPLSYHHLIPRSVHEKVLKKGWHDEWLLNSVAWLCRACHSFVHRMASNEELAREWYTVERICEREDVRDWAKWVGRVRWKAR
ncbi:hypothetical protein BJX99DRAFT_119696 [Aspergillus californicus]